MTNDAFLPALTRRSSFVQYALSCATIALALVAGQVLSPLLGGSMPFVAVLPAIAFAAWYCGLGPSIASSVIALAVLKYSLITPGHAVALSTVREALDLAVLGAVFALVVGLGERRHRECEALRGAQDDLEQRVQERTAALDAANQSLRELTARLMRTQDEERRRIARELHDSVGQSLAAMTINLTTVLAEVERLVTVRKAAADSLELAQEMNREVRTVSYLLHPPLLDEAGLASALRWYVQGFSERGNIQVELDITDDFGRLPQDLETALFRTVQECLTNIHRHSGSSVAHVRVVKSGDQIQLRVSDEGRGIPAEKIAEMKASGSPGVGIRGMRERLQQLGGTLEIHSDDRGTTVEVQVPVSVASEVAA